MNPVAAEKQFTVESPSATLSSFEAALEKSFEKSGVTRSDRDGPNVAVFKKGYKYSLNAYMCRLLTFVA